MKTDYRLNGVIYALLMCMALAVTACYNDSKLVEQLAEHESQIKTINEQIVAVNKSLPALQKVDQELDAYIKAIQKTSDDLKARLDAIEEQLNAGADDELKGELQKLKSYVEDEIAMMDVLIGELLIEDENLEARIDKLNSYVEKTLREHTDWANATFSTLEQYQMTQEQIAEIRTLMGELNGGLEDVEANLKDKLAKDMNDIQKSITQAYKDAISIAKTEVEEACASAIAAAIDASETSMKDWVSSVLSEGYYDIAAIDGKIDALESLIEAGGNEGLISEISQLRSELEQVKTDMKEEYEAAIAEAINSSNGLIRGEIATSVQNATKQLEDSLAETDKELEDIRLALRNLEARVATMEEQMLNITTSISDLEAMKEELEAYCDALEEAKAELEKKLEEAEKTLNDLLEDGLGETNQNLAAQMEALQNSMNQHLTKLNETISALEKKDVELQSAIENLLVYVDKEFAGKTWVETTFATLDEYHELSAIVAGIEPVIASLEDSFMELEDSLQAELEMVQAAMNGEIDARAKEITQAYQAAVEAVRADITRAYTAELDAAIIALEASMKEWVNSQLTAYYTKEEIDQQLTILSTQFTSQLEDQKQYIMSLLMGEIEDLENMIALNSDMITALGGQLSDAEKNIIANSKQIAANAETIIKNATEIAANAENIEEHADMLAEHEGLIKENSDLIAQNKSSIDASIAENVAAIAKNAVDIAGNAALIAKNALAISNNAAAIAANSEEIAALKVTIEETEAAVTTAYQEAIAFAIETLGGQLRGEAAATLAEINATINSAVEAVNALIAALDTRMTAAEKEIKLIKQAIYNIQEDIATMQQQITDILARIQSMVFVPEYADGRATMSYTNASGNITPGTAVLKYEVRPADVADDLAEVWEDALNVKAVYTQTRAAGDIVNLDIQSVTAENGILTVVVSGSALSDEFYRSEIFASVALEISNGYNDFITEYTQMMPWTTNTVHIPDSNFKTYLLEEFDENSDGEISLDEAENIKEIDIAASILQVTSLTGIEYFTNLEKLDCSYHRITSLELENNVKLTDVNVSNNKLTKLLLPASVVTLDASRNQLTSLEVTHAKDLVSLNVANNKIADINVAQNKALTSLDVSDNELMTLDVSKLIWLETLACGGNNLSTLSLTRNTVLESLDCHGNNLTLLDLVKNTALTTLDCGQNSLVALYLGSTAFTSIDCADNALASLNVSLQTKLESLDCSGNSLVTIDLTKCTKLETLDCSDNRFESLNLSSNLALTQLDCSGNAALTKLWLKDEEQETAVAITKDDSTMVYFKKEGSLYIPDAALKATLVANYDDDNDGEISSVEADNITSVSCSGKGVTDLTGLESCTNLVTLNCSNNNITTIDLPNLQQLRTVICYGNPLTKISLTDCVSLSQFNIINSTTNAINGVEFKVDGYNSASTMDINLTGAPFTTFSFVNANSLNEIKFYGGFDIVNLYGNTSLESIDVNPIAQLETLDVHGCKLQTLDVTQKEALVWLDASSNELTQMDVTRNLQLQYLDLNANELSVMNVRNNTALTHLNVSDNSAIEIVNVSQNTLLKDLYAEGLSIVDINLSNNNELTNVWLRNNSKLETIIAWDACVTTRNDFIHFDMAGMYVQDSAGNHYGYPFHVGQYIPWFNGGVVFHVENDGANGKIVSVGQTSKAWSNYRVNISADDQNYGINNHIKVRSQTDWRTTYPAFSWCEAYGHDNWYLPAKNELMRLYNNVSSVNRTLSNHGHESIVVSPVNACFYWSSTEYDYEWAYRIQFSSGSSSSSGSKTSTYSVRAILTF